MTAKTETQSRSGSRCLVALLAAAALVGIIALIAMPALNQHAKLRHGAHAVSAVKYMGQYTPEPDDDEQFWTGTDKDGRDYTILKLRELPGKPVTWAIVIVVGGCLVTAFLAQSPRTIGRLKEKCE